MMNLRKILISLGLAVILIIMVGGAASAQNSAAETEKLPLSNKQLFSKLLTEIGIQNPDYAFKFSDLFSGGEKNYGQNLYLAVYQKVAIEPESEAIKIVGQAKGLNSAEVEAVLAGSLEPLIQRYPRITQEQAASWARQMRDLYNDYVDSESLRSEAAAMVAPTEIFANNDTNDSGFDLIADLNDIEMILFRDVVPGDINMKYSGGYPSEPVSKPQQIEPGPKPTYPFPQAGLSGGLVTDTTGGISAGKIGAEAGAAGADAIDVYKQPQACPGDPVLNQLINDYDKNNPSVPLTPSSGKGSGKGAAGAGGGVEAGSAEDIFEINPSVTELDSQELKPAEAGNWKDNPLCSGNKRFCIEISTHSSIYNLYYPTDPCIVCHVEKINTAMAKLVSHNLVPRKLTGNLMEMAKCKSGYNLSQFVNINLILVPMPIIVPPKMEAIFGRNIFDEFKKFVNKYTLFRIDENRDKAAEIADTWASGETTQDEMLRNIQAMIFKNKLDAEKQFKNMAALNKSSVQGEFFQSILYQLEEMKALFESFKQLFIGAGAACEKIKNKDYVD